MNMQKGGYKDNSVRANQESNNRIDYYDVLRGIAIILVVAIHSLNPAYISGSTLYFFVFWRNLICFSVPLFVTISGFFIGKKQINSANLYLLFLKKQLPRVMIPYLIWSIPYSFIAYKNGLPVDTVIFRIMTFQSAFPFYFIALVIQFYILAPFLHRLANKTGLIICGLISSSFCFLIYYLKYSINMELPLIIYAGLFVPYLFFCVLGVYIGRGNVLITKRRNSLIMTGIALCLLTISSIYEYRIHLDFTTATSTIRFPSFLYSFCIICFIFNSKNIYFKSNILRYIGTVSFGIYFLHILYLEKISKIIHSRFMDVNEFVLQIIVAALVISISVLICFIFRKIHYKYSTKYLGL